MSDVIETRGRFRAVIHDDTDPQPPEDDASGTVVRLDRWGAEVVGHAYSVPADDHDILSAWQHYQDMTLVERYLRMWHGVVGFDYFDTRDAKYVNLVTLADLKVWGWDSVDEYRAATGHDDPSHGNLTEWQAYVDGDVYGFSIEKNVHWTTDDDDVSDMDTWEDMESVWGFYGREYVQQAALEALAAHADKAAE